mmetsp:Transcript_8575/g.12963  ORF Transcript_8575/g.12963 Transcript_8575/m.12963 type:complete len:341 (+) Transcript_8575:3-1025(+)
MNHVPVLGHAKAAIQAAAGDHEQAWKTTEECNTVTSHVPILGHIKAGVHAAAGHFDRAQKSLDQANSATDYVPVAGHLKGLVHHFAGHYDKRDKTLHLADEPMQILMESVIGAHAGMSLGRFVGGLPMGITLGIMQGVAGGAMAVHHRNTPDYVIKPVNVPQLRDVPATTQSGTPLKFAILNAFGELKRSDAITEEEFQCMKERVLQTEPSSRGSAELTLLQVQADELKNLHKCLLDGDVSLKEYQECKVPLLNLVVSTPGEMEATSAGQKNFSAFECGTNKATSSIEEEPGSSALTRLDATLAQPGLQVKKPTRRGGMNKRMHTADVCSIPDTDDGFEK